MAQIVINIPDVTYEFCNRYGYDNDIISQAVKNGILLPKGHGRLIDADKLIQEYRTTNIVHHYGEQIVNIVNDSATVIEAVKEMEITWNKVRENFSNPKDIGNSDLKGYESPITMFVQDLITDSIKKQEDQLIYSLSQTIGYQIDKEQLVRALRYDRNQYKKGYADAKKEILEKIYNTFNGIQCYDGTGYDIYSEIKEALEEDRND